jgi:hypothetical protein
VTSISRVMKHTEMLIVGHLNQLILTTVLMVGALQVFIEAWNPFVNMDHPLEYEVDILCHSALLLEHTELILAILWVQDFFKTVQDILSFHFCDIVVEWKNIVETLSDGFKSTSGIVGELRDLDTVNSHELSYTTFCLFSF